MTAPQQQINIELGTRFTWPNLCVELIRPLQPRAYGITRVLLKPRFKEVSEIVPALLLRSELLLGRGNSRIKGLIGLRIEEACGTGHPVPQILALTKMNGGASCSSKARRRGSAETSAKDPRAHIVLIAGLAPGVDPVALARRLARSSLKAGIKAVAFDHATLGREPDWIGMAEADNDLVLLAARHDEGDWLTLCRRQVDRIMLLGRSDAAPPRRSPGNAARRPE